MHMNDMNFPMNFRRHEWFNFDCVNMGNPDQTRHLKMLIRKETRWSAERENPHTIPRSNRTTTTLLEHNASVTVKQYYDPAGY